MVSRCSLAGRGPIRIAHVVGLHDAEVGRCRETWPPSAFELGRAGQHHPQPRCRPTNHQHCIHRQGADDEPAWRDPSVLRHCGSGVAVAPSVLSALFAQRNPKWWYMGRAFEGKCRRRWYAVACSASQYQDPPFTTLRL